MDKLIEKYNVAVPRYTSYPPANYFHELITPKEYIDVIKASNGDSPENISIYFHIPFCRHLCFYCGCNSFAMPENERVNAYFEALNREVDMTIKMLDKKRKISQVHFGGGSPTAVEVVRLSSLIDKFRKVFDFTSDAEIAIECHPGYLDESYFEELIAAGFNRVSLGIQDFNEEVLKKVNRRPSKLDVGRIFQILRDGGVKVNMDFIYGLPGQSVESFSETILKASQLAPDRIVTFSYAHVPWVNPMQKKLERDGLPDADTKSGMYDAAKEILRSAGYKSIGLDHFVKDDDLLYEAVVSGELHRNFQGYCTRRTTGQVYAFGVTAISQLSSAYIQNVKTIDEYINAISESGTAYKKGYILTLSECITGDVIATLMCNRKVVWADIANRFGVSEEYVKGVTAFNEKRINDFIVDGIVENSSEALTVTDFGSMFIRNVASSLDPLMLNSSKSFSKSL